MPTGHRWIIAVLLVTGTLGLVAAAGLALARRMGELTFTVPAGRAQNALTLRVSGPNLVLLDGATQAVLESRPLASTQGVTIQGAPGNVDDALTVDLSGGALALPDGIHFDGGAGGYDTLVMTGGENAPGSYTATGPGAGVLAHAGTRVVFSNLEPVTDTTTATDFTVLGTAGNNTINIVNGGSGCLGFCQLIQVNSPSFESIAFANKTNVSVTGLAGADTFNLNTSLPATGLHKLVLDGGGNPGDSINIVNFTLPASSGTLSLTNVITVTQSGVIAVTNLAVHAAGPMDLGNLSNKITQFAGNTTASGAFFTLASSAPILTVGAVEGLLGITTQHGQTIIYDTAAGGTLVVNNAIATAGADVSLFADHMTFNAALAAGAGSVYLDNSTYPEPILLGTKPAGALGLLQTDLNRITAGVLQIGDFDTDTGGLTVTAPITAPAGWSTLDLRQDASIDENTTSVSVANLALRAHGGSVFFSERNNHVATLAGETTDALFEFSGSGPLTIGTVAGVSGISTAGGSIYVGTHSGGVVVHQPVLAGASGIEMFANESASPNDNLTVDPGVVVSSTNGDVVLSAGDHLSLEAGSAVETAGGGHLLLAFSVGDTDNLGGATIAGTVSASSHIPQASGDIADDTLLIDFQAGAALPNDLIYDGGPGLNALTYTDAGGSSPHRYNLSGTVMARDLANLVHTSRVQVMTAIGGSGPDAFDVIPDAGTVIHAIGGLPGHPAGDILVIEPVGTTNPTLHVTGFDATGETGQWTFGNRQPVDFTGIDSFANLSHQTQLPLVRK